MLADRPDDDDADPIVLIERLEHQPQLIALRHRDDIVGRPVENDVGALPCLVDLDLETVELAEPGIRFERITMSLVRVMPIIFCSRAEPPEPGIWPSFCSGSE